MDLLGDRLPPVAEADEDVDQHRDDEHTDDASGEEHRPLQVVDPLRVLPGWFPRVLRCVLGTSRGEQHDAGGDAGA